MDSVMHLAVNSARVYRGRPGFGIILTVGADLRRHAVVIDFAYARGEVSMCLEPLRQCGRVWELVSKVVLIAHHPCLLRVQAGQKAGSARAAHRILTVSPIKSNTLVGQPVNVRADDQMVAVGAQVCVQVVNYNEKHIGWRWTAA